MADRSLPLWRSLALGAVFLAGSTAALAEPSVPPPPKGEVAGTVCLLAAEADTLHLWQPADYYTGRGLRARSSPGDSGHADFLLTILTPGSFRVHLLGARRPNADPEASAVALSLWRDEPSGMQVAATEIRFRDLNAIAWSDLDATGQPGAHLSIPAAGRYRLRLAAARDDGFFVEKVLLTTTGLAPAGLGPAPTRIGDQPTAPGAPDPLVVLPPAWAFGVLYGGYTNQAETLDTVNRLAAADFPIDAYWIDSWFWNFQDKGRGPRGYMDFAGDPTAFPDLPAFWGELQRRHIKAGVWIWDCILREGNEAVFDEFNRAGLFSDIFIQRDRWHNQTGLTICGNLNFEKPETVALWRTKLEPFFAAGLDFFKIDRNSSVLFSQAAFEASQQLGRETGGRGFILAHLHSTHDPRTKLYPTKWSGDAKIAWEQPGYPDTSISSMGALKENIGMIADPKRSTSAVPFLAHDAGGYDTFADGRPSDELYARWLQFSAFSPVTTLFSFAASPTRNHPINYPAPIQATVRKYLQLRMRLFPYLYTAALNTRLHGTRMVQGDGVHEYQYLFGDSLLVAPVFTPGAVTREVALPAGRWFDWDSGEAWEGGRTITVPAPLEKLPLFVRAGALVPLRDYASSIEAGSNHHLTLEAYPDADYSTATLREDDGRSNDYLEGRIAATRLSLQGRGANTTLVIDPVQGGYAGMPADRAWTVRLHLGERPVSALRSGKPLEVAYDEASGIATVHFTAPRTERVTLVLSAATPPAADTGTPRLDYSDFLPRHESFLARGRSGPVGLLFLGDSITQAWEKVPQLWQERYGRWQPANFGISGDRTQSVIWRLEHGELDGLDPQAVVLLIGTNNTDKHTAEQILAGQQRILQLIRARLPRAKVLLLGVFPRGPRTGYDGQPDPWEKRMAIIRSVNAGLSALADGRSVFFLDFGAKFFDAEGRIPSALMPDQLHLSPAGYAVWADAMQPTLDRLLR